MVAGSTHAGEERTILNAFSGIRGQHPHLRLLIAPRYPDRGRGIARRSRAHGFRTARFSEDGSSALRGASVVVLDTLGDLASAYGLAELAFVGGTFVRRGGQNLLEPAACGTPVLFGPHTENFEDAAAALERGGGFRVHDAGDLVRVATDLLDDTPERIRQGTSAREVVRGMRAVASINADLLLDLLPHAYLTPSTRARLSRA